VRKFLVMMSLCACVSGLAQGREVIFWGKSMEARKGQERACFYATVSVPSDVQKSNMLLTISFKKVPAEKKNDVAEFPWIAKVSRGNDFNLGTESGDVMEACVKPGRYAISELKLSTGVPGVGAYYAMFDRGLGLQPVSLEFQAGKDYYLGNFLVYRDGPQRITIRDQLARDAGLIAKHAKAKPATPLILLPIETGTSTWLQNGQ